MQVGVAGNVVGERGKRGGDVGIDEGDEAVAARRLPSGERFLEHRVVVREQMLGEAHRILVVHRERLQVDGGTLVAALRQDGDLGTHDSDFLGSTDVRNYLNTSDSAPSVLCGPAPTSGAWPRSTELPSNSVRWSTLSGSSQCDSSIWPLWP